MKEPQEDLAKMLARMPIGIDLKGSWKSNFYMGHAYKSQDYDPDGDGNMIKVRFSPSNIVAWEADVAIDKDGNEQNATMVMMFNGLSYLLDEDIDDFDRLMLKINSTSNSRR